jgi:hypothetical protein
VNVAKAEKIDKIGYGEIKARKSNPGPKVLNKALISS